MPLIALSYMSKSASWAKVAFEDGMDVSLAESGEVPRFEKGSSQDESFLKGESVTMLPAQVKVRLQARDGKILGPAAKTPLLTATNLTRNEILFKDQEFNNAASGEVVASLADGVSRNAIVVESPAIPAYPPPGPYWLQPPIGAGELIAQLYLTEPTQVEFRATAFAPYPVYSSATLWVLPGMQLLDDPGLVITVAGLYTTATASATGGTVSVTATVAMMCGCPITAPPPPDLELYWPSSEFDVRAEIRPQGDSNSYPLPLTFQATNTFSGSLDLPSGLRGTFEVWVVAVQAKETNVGFARTTVTVT